MLRIWIGKSLVFVNSVGKYLFMMDIMLGEQIRKDPGGLKGNPLTPASRRVYLGRGGG